MTLLIDRADQADFSGHTDHPDAAADHTDLVDEADYVDNLLIIDRLLI